MFKAKRMQIDYKIDLGHILTATVLMLGFAVQYGSLSTRVTVVEVQAAKTAATNEALLTALHSLQDTIVKVQTQMEERERRFDLAQQNRQDQRDLHAVR